MEVLWSPWRSKYIERFKDEDKHKDEVCFFCEAAESPDRDKELLVVARRDKCFAMLNKFPYNNGHALIAPYEHIGELKDIDAEVMLDMMNLVKETNEALEKMYSPHGFNVGINLGRAAGAGVPGHMHIHIVPRWNGDTSFTAVLSDIKVVSQSLEDTQELLTKYLKK